MWKVERRFRHSGRRDNTWKEKGRQDQNKAVYTAAPVAGGWAGAVMS